MNAASVLRVLQAARSTITVEVPSASFLDTESGRNNQLPPIIYTPVGVLTPDTAASTSQGDEATDDSGMQVRRVRGYIAAILQSGAAWPVPRAGYVLRDGQQSYNVEAVTVYYRNDVAILYEVRASA